MDALPAPKRFKYDTIYITSDNKVVPAALSCDPLVDLSCDPAALSCDPTALSCDPLAALSCDPTALSCDPTALSCDPTALSCDPLVDLSCDPSINCKLMTLVSAALSIPTDPNIIDISEPTDPNIIDISELGKKRFDELCPWSKYMLINIIKLWVLLQGSSGTMRSKKKLTKFFMETKFENKSLYNLDIDDASKKMFMMYECICMLKISMDIVSIDNIKKQLRITDDLIIDITFNNQSVFRSLENVFLDVIKISVINKKLKMY